MNYPFLIELILFILLIGLSGFFSSSETSLFSLKKIQLKQMTQNNHPRADLLKRMLKKPRRLIITILIGNEFVNILASVISASMVIQVFGRERMWVNIVIVVPLLLLFGEIIPKTMAIRNNMAFASFESLPIEWFAKITKPIRWLIRVVADFFITGIAGKKCSTQNIITEDMMRTIAYDAADKGALDNQEAQFIDQILSFDDKTIEDIMTPRSHICFLREEIPLTEMVSEMHRVRHTKAPVFKKNRDTIIGVLHIRALLGIDIRDKLYQGRGKEKLFLPPYFVPESKLASELFSTFRERKISLAMTVDEYGGITGLVTMEDLLECIFGDIHSPSDTSPHDNIIKIDNSTFLIDAGVQVADFNEKMGAKLLGHNVDTLGGFLLHHYGELPDRDTLILLDDLSFTIKSVQNNRISEVLVKKMDA